MITIVNNENLDAYQKLYGEALKELKALDKKQGTNRYDNAQINSLESYFTYIEDLISLKKDNDPRFGDIYGRKYSILPLQEEYFEIDANSRSIKVPETFRKNGLGVWGDQAAETIYFRINRYFDAMDLYNTDIYIQWENADGTLKGLSKEWVRDIETFDDYMVFGWVLGNDITATPGTLKFSVRFIKTVPVEGSEAKVIKYSLNTLTAQAMINTALNLPIGTADDSLNAILAGAIENTTTKTDTEILVFKYVYEFDNLLQTNENGNIINLKDDVVSADLIEVNGNKQLLIQVSAYADKGTMSYRLYKQTGDTPSLEADRDNYVEMNIKDGYLPTGDTTFQNDKLYYVWDQSKSKYEIYSSENSIGLPIPKGEGETVYYELYGTYILDEAHKVQQNSITGYYYTTASAIVSDGSESSQLISSRRILLSPPQEATFKTDITVDITGNAVGVGILPDVNTVEQDNKEYVWYRKRYNDNQYNYIDTVASEFIPEEEAYYLVKIKTTRNLDSVITDNGLVYCVTVPPTQSDIIIGNNGNGATYPLGTPIGPMAKYTPNNPLNNNYSLTYQWYKDGEILTGAIGAQYTPSEAGNYHCVITAHYNDLTASKETGIFIIE